LMQMELMLMREAVHASKSTSPSEPHRYLG
jgi:hypothetical protein